jgi:peptidoglycan/LPS O-acetylase OafA/YrhL
MPTQPLTTAESLALDIIRVLASIMVAFGHLTESQFSTGWRDCTDFAVDAVGIFFVLSGFVIRHATLRRPATLATYLGDRASRLYSVILPAFLLTIVADWLSHRIDPAYYNALVPSNFAPWAQIGVNLVFAGQLWHHVVDPLSNHPYWSVNYEAGYYLIYGCFFYLTGTARWLSTTFICALFGPLVLYLFPLWLSGCVAHDLYQRWNAAGTTATNLGRIALAALALVLTTTALILYLRVSPALLNSNRIAATLGSQRLGVHAYLRGLCWSIVLLAVLRFARRFTLRADAAAVRAIRFIAEGTFPIYLFHFPLMVAIAACIPYNHAAALPKVIIFLNVLAAGILSGHLCNLLKLKLRGLFSRLTPSSSRVPVPS